MKITQLHAYLLYTPVSKTSTRKKGRKTVLIKCVSLTVKLCVFRVYERVYMRVYG